MSKKHDKYEKVRIYPETRTAIDAFLKKVKVKPCFTLLSNQAIVAGLKQLK